MRKPFVLCSIVLISFPGLAGAVTGAELQRVFAEAQKTEPTATFQRSCDASGHALSGPMGAYSNDPAGWLAFAVGIAAMFAFEPSDSAGGCGTTLVGREYQVNWDGKISVH